METKIHTPTEDVEARAGTGPVPLLDLKPYFASTDCHPDAKRP